MADSFVQDCLYNSRIFLESGCRVFFYRLLADGAGWVLSNR